LTFVIASMQVGGAERVLATMANYWSSRGWRVSIVTLAPGDEAPFYRLDPEIEYIPLGLLRSSVSMVDALRRNAGRLRALRRAVKGTQPGIVISFMTECNVLTLLATRGLGVPVIVSEHTDPAKCPISPVWSLLRTTTYRWADLVVFLTRQARDHFGRLRNAVVIPNPVRACGGDRRSPAAGRESIVLAIGRLGPEKGFDVLIRAFASLGDAGRCWRLLILGQGPERERLERLAEDLGIGDRVQMPGVVDDPEAHLQRAGIFVLSSRFEGFPMSVCEAMACGLPVIATEYSQGVYDLVQPGENGMVVPPEDVAALTGAVRELIRDTALRERLGNKATGITERYGVESVMETWERIIEECCS